MCLFAVGAIENKRHVVDSWGGTRNVLAERLFQNAVLPEDDLNGCLAGREMGVWIFHRVPRSTQQYRFLLSSSQKHKAQVPAGIPDRRSLFPLHVKQWIFDQLYMARQTGILLYSFMGLTAIPFAFYVKSQGPLTTKTLVQLWNLVGLFDLVSGIGMAMLNFWWLYETDPDCVRFWVLPPPSLVTLHQVPPLRLGLICNF